jgi:hypothetical protein
MANVRLLQQTILAIEDRPDLLRSDQWATRTSTGVTYDFAAWAITLAYPDAAFAFDRRVDGDTGPITVADKVIPRPGDAPAWIQDVAVELLDLDAETADILFADENRVADLTRIVDAILETADDSEFEDVAA